MNILPGDNSERDTPVPIPNTEVKPLSANGTARGTAWESRSLPGFFYFFYYLKKSFRKIIVNFLIKTFPNI